MRYKFLLRVVGSAALVASLFGTASALAIEPANCSDLIHFQAPNVTITIAQSEEPPFTIPGGPGSPAVSKPFCRLAGFLTPTTDSHIVFEVWLPPATAWNHKYQGVGNGGFAGSVNYRAMLAALNRGYATMATDAGHVGDPANPVEDVTWALGHPEKFVDYAYRAEHLSTVASKQLIDAFYGVEPAHSYYTGCSAGGIQGMVELLRYPKDYDGYVIGDATPDHLGQEVGAFWNTLEASLADPVEALKPSQISLVHDKILRQCVGKDGGVGTDLFLSNPLACSFNAKTLACSAGQDPSTCLSPKQVAEIAAIYHGPIDPHTHQRILAGLTPGTEATWDRFFSGKKNPAGTERPWAGFMADVAMSDPDYLVKEKYLTFNFGTDLASVRQKKIAGETLDAVFNTKSRDLDPIKAEGGKVIHYHGWDDANIPALEAVDFFQDVVADQAKRHGLTLQKAQDETEQFYRLFMVPGMGHCSGGAGPNSFGQSGGRPLKADPEYDTVSALEVWVEKGVAPEKFIGSRVDAKTGSVDMTRPICAYPKVPTWNGTGNPNDANSFVCAEKLQSTPDSK
jgi:feruloyl esterase